MVDGFKLCCQIQVAPLHHVLKTSSYESLLKRKKWGNANSGAAPKTPNTAAGGGHSAGTPGGGAPSGMSEAGLACTLNPKP
jgi:hypothetical protein